MQNIFLLESLLYFLKQSQSSKKLWVKFKKTKFSLKIIKILFKYKIISGYITKDKIIIIFLKYYHMKPAIKKYIIFSTPTKKKLLIKNYLINLKKKNPQSFFFILNKKNIQQLIINSNNLEAGILLFQIN